MPYPTRILDADELSAIFDDHSETIYLGEWKELRIGPLKLVRHDDGAIVVREVEADCLSL
jgi:hypothetical protein